MDGGAWWATVHGVTKSQTRLSNFTFFHFASWKKSYDQPRQHILKLYIESESEVTQSCPTLWDPMDCSPLGSSIHGILQARILE